jgi:isopentenyl-diphosphate delta-isomerase
VTKAIADGLLHRAFSVFLFNSEGKLLIQQRAGCKITFPLMWANTCCSHPLYVADELVEEAALGVRKAASRKVAHELGITELYPEDLTFLTKIHYEAAQDANWGEHEIDWLLFAKKDVALNLNDNEVESVRWVTPEELTQMFADCAAGKLYLAPWFQLIAEKYLLKWWPRVDEIIAHGGLPDDLKEGLVPVNRLGTPGNARTAASFL